LNIQVTPQTEWDGELTIILSPAVDQPAPGKPGKKIGEVQLVGEDRAVVSLGKIEKLNADKIRQAGGLLAKWLGDHGVAQTGLELAGLSGFNIETAEAALCEGLLLGAFRFEEHSPVKFRIPLSTYSQKR
jgi:hypothetical protein